MDKKVLRKLVKADLSNEDAQKVLAKHWGDVSLLKKQRDADRLRSLQLLKDKKNRAEFDVNSKKKYNSLKRNEVH